MKLAARGGKNGKKRAIVAVARKLAVLLHRLLITGEVYEPLRNSQAVEGGNGERLCRQPRRGMEGLSWLVLEERNDQGIVTRFGLR